MIKNIRYVVLAASIALAGCNSTPADNKEIYTVGGAVIGMTLGYGLGKDHSDKDLAMAAGAIAGGLFGRSIGAKLDERDELLQATTMQNALEFERNGIEHSWQNPNTGNKGTTIPTNVIWQSENVGNPCRDFVTTVIIGGEETEAYGRACRQADMSWVVQ